jgi:hypothetical protein
MRIKLIMQAPGYAVLGFRFIILQEADVYSCFFERSIIERFYKVASAVTMNYWFEYFEAGNSVSIKGIWGVYVALY